MKIRHTLLLTAMALGASATMTIAQDNPPPGPPPGPGAQGGDRPPRRPAPIVEALDANTDGVIDESEIANAATALKSLDKNGDGKLTTDEIRPPRGPGQGGPGADGQGGRRGGRNKDAGDNTKPAQ